MPESRAQLEEMLVGVQGWFGDEEAWALHEVVRTHPSGGGSGPTVVEVGSWQGRSTIVLASAVRDRGAGVVHSIDPHAGTEIHESTGTADTHEAFLANVRAAGLDEYVHSIRALSTDGREQFADGSVDVLLLDGAHGYEDVVNDVRAWTPALADVATVAFHDAATYRAVRQAIRDRVLRIPSPFRNPRMVEDTLLVDFRRSASGRIRASLGIARFKLSWR